MPVVSLSQNKEKSFVHYPVFGIRGNAASGMSCVFTMDAIDVDVYKSTAG